MSSLTVMIPSRNEEWLLRTIQDILKNMRGDTTIIAVLDGQWPTEPIPDHPKVHLVYHPVSIGQRAATNEAARLASSRYLMKADAHCAFDEGFDIKLMAPYENGELGMDTTTIPRMYNLHVFDWICDGCGLRTYQGPKPVACKTCQSPESHRDVVWTPRLNRGTDFARFSSEPKFEYWSAYKHRPEAAGDLADVMCCVGAGWLMPRDWYWHLGGCDEGHGSWGSQGIEVACKSWLSGGRQVVNKRTWFSHLFRTQPGFGWPYEMSGKQVAYAKKYSRDLWFNNKWPTQTRPLSWLLEKFSPVPGWHEPANAADLAYVTQKGQSFAAPAVKAPTVLPSVGVVYYTNNQLDPAIFNACQHQLQRNLNGNKLVSVSMVPMAFGENVVVPGVSGPLQMFRQILAGLEKLDTDYACLCEHDVLYDCSHFTFIPPRRDTYYYNTHFWRVDAETGRAVTYDYMPVAGLCADRQLLVEHYRKMVAEVEAHGYDHGMGYEPGLHPGRKPGVDSHPVVGWKSAAPNVDIRHGENLTASRWSQDAFRDKTTCQHWQEADAVPGWGMTKSRVSVWLHDLGQAS